MVYILQKRQGHERQRQDEGPFQIKEEGWKLNAFCDLEPERKIYMKDNIGTTRRM